MAARPGEMGGRQTETVTRAITAKAEAGDRRAVRAPRHGR